MIDVDIFIIQKLQDTVIHLEVDEEQCGRSHKEVRDKPGGYSPHVRCQVYGFQILHMLNTNTTIRPSPVVTSIILFLGSNTPLLPFVCHQVWRVDLRN